MNSPFHRPDEPKEISEVNVVPLADVSLVLLIILLLLSPMMTQSMLKVKTAGRSVPAPSELEPPLLPTPVELVLAVSVTPQGYSVGEKSFSSKQDLRLFLSNELLRRVDKKVFVTPHPDVSHGDVVDALELCKDAGAETVALVQTQEERGEVRPIAPAP